MAKEEESKEKGKEKDKDEKLTKAEKNAIRKKERKAYIERKRWVMNELEPHNRQKIVFVQGMLGFYSCFGTGAILLHKLVLPRVDKKLRLMLRKDSDWACQAKYGVVSVKNMELIKRKMLQYPGMFLVKESEEFVSFSLAKPLSEEEFERLTKKDEIARQAMLKKLTRMSPMQNVFATLLELTRIVDRLERHHTEKMMFELYGRDLNGCVKEMVYAYMRLARKEAEPLSTIAKITDAITRADAMLIMIDEVGCWTHDECADVGDELAKLSRLMVAEERKAKQKIAAKAEEKASAVAKATAAKTSVAKVSAEKAEEKCDKIKEDEPSSPSEVAKPTPPGEKVVQKKAKGGRSAVAKK